MQVTSFLANKKSPSVILGVLFCTKNLHRYNMTHLGECHNEINEAVKKESDFFLVIFVVLSVLITIFVNSTQMDLTTMCHGWRLFFRQIHIVSCLLLILFSQRKNFIAHCAYLLGFGLPCWSY